MENNSKNSFETIKILNFENIYDNGLPILMHDMKARVIISKCQED
jgi:hypothetical protein